MKRAFSLLISIFVPVRVRITRWEDRRTLLQQADGDLIWHRVQACKPCPADLYMRVDRREVPEWLMKRVPAILRRQAA